MDWRAVITATMLAAAIAIGGLALGILHQKLEAQSAERVIEVPTGQCWVDGCGRAEV